jgi:gliding motility-associated protein GldM
MAGGNLSPRQKMINLMYLVFIAMLAMNMSKEVLSSFGFLNEKLTEANAKSTLKNEAALSVLSGKAAEQKEKYEPLRLKADQIKKLSDGLYNDIESLKNEMTESLPDKMDYEVMDQSKFLDDYFFSGEGYSKKGTEFVAKIDNYRTSLIQIMGPNSSHITNVIEERFKTTDATTREGKKKKWLKYHFEAFPLIASLTNLTQIQMDIKTTETEILSELLQGQLISDVSMTKYEAIVIPTKTAFFQGENFKGKIVLGKVDPTLKPTSVEINGRKVSDNNIEAGQVLLEFPAGSVGENNIKGKFVFMENGKPVEIPISSTYAVVSKPNSAVVSADKMNVVYRGVENPITISIPGVADNNVTASAPGLRKATGTGKYVLNPESGDAVTIKVSGKLPDGSVVSSGQSFRIKEIPAPATSVRGEYGALKMPRESLAKSTIGAVLPDFEFDLNLGISGFKVKVPGQATVIVNGSRFDDQAQRALDRAKFGDIIIIFDVKAQIQNNASYKLKNVLPVSIELTN